LIDVCAMTSSDEGRTWQFDTDASIKPWRSSNGGDSWTQHSEHAGDGIVLGEVLWFVSAFLLSPPFNVGSNSL